MKSPVGHQADLDTIGVIHISIQSFTKLVGIGSCTKLAEQGDCASSSVAWVRCCRTTLVLGGVNTFEHEPGERRLNDGDVIDEKRTECIC